jgi:hypothetical protein
VICTSQNSLSYFKMCKKCKVMKIEKKILFPECEERQYTLGIITCIKSHLHLNVCNGREEKRMEKRHQTLALSLLALSKSVTN